jgi:hypothetical protein
MCLLGLCNVHRRSEYWANNTCLSVSKFWNKNRKESFSLLKYAPQKYAAPTCFSSTGFVQQYPHFILKFSPESIKQCSRHLFLRTLHEQHVHGRASQIRIDIQLSSVFREQAKEDTHTHTHTHTQNALSPWSLFSNGSQIKHYFH